MIAPESGCSTNEQSSPESGRLRQIWQTFRREFGSVLVVGHGTRNPNGARQLLELVGHMQTREPNANICGCFLELAEPTIEQAIEQLHDRGIKRILVVPVLLFTAAHALQDIPDAVAGAAALFGIEVIGQTGSLGTHDSVIALSQARYSEVTSLEQGSVCPENACARVQCPSGRCEGQGKRMGHIGLAMVGRGTSDPLALKHMRQLTQLKVERLSTVASQTGFFAGGIPNVDGLLDEASQWECDTVLVQPHLLFEGELIEQLRSKVQQCQLQFPDKQWFVSRTLGADPMLADVFLALAVEQLPR